MKHLSMMFGFSVSARSDLAAFYREIIAIGSRNKTPVYPPTTKTRSSHMHAVPPPDRNVNGR